MPIESSGNSSKFLPQAEFEGLTQREQVRETTGWRPLRRSLLDQVGDTQERSGRFLGVIGLESVTARKANEEHLSLAEALGIEGHLERIFRAHGTACCPHCGDSCRILSIESAKSKWSNITEGVLLVGIELPHGSVRSGHEVAEMAGYWEAQRVTDGERVWSLEDLTDAPIDSRQRWSVILDSARAPLSSAFELRIQVLAQRTSSTENRLVLFLYSADAQTVSMVTEIGDGWRCETCARSYRWDNILRYRIKSFDSDRIFERPISELEELIKVLPIREEVLADAARVMKAAALPHLSLGLSVARLSFAEKNFLQLARAFIGGVYDTPFILDSVSEIMDFTQKKALAELRSIFDVRNNRLVDLSASSVEPDIETRKISLEELIDRCEQPGVQIFKPERLSEVDSPALFARLVESMRLHEATKSSGRSIVAASIAELREPSDTSLGTLIGLREIFEDLLAKTPSAYRAGRLCPRCLGGGMRELKNESVRCECLTEKASHDDVRDHDVLGRPLSTWVQKPIAELMPLLHGYPRMAGLVGGLNAIGLADSSAAFSAEGFSDLQLQAIRLLLHFASIEIDLYKKTKSRRRGKTRLLMLLRPYWGMSDELVAVLREQCDRLILPGDTVAYLDSRV